MQYLFGLYIGCQIKWTDHGEFITNSGELLLFSGKDEGENHANGVGILLSRNARNNLIDWHPYGDRILTIRIRTRVRKLTFVQCYAPTETSFTDEKEDFHLKLTAVLETIPKGDIKILIGDLNAKVGSNNQNLERVMGKYGIGERNANGNLFVQLCSDYNLVIGGTLFPHKNIHKTTSNFSRPPDKKSNRPHCHQWYMEILPP